MSEDVSRVRQRRIREWQNGERSPRFTPGKMPMRLWPHQRARADKSLAVENLRRAYLKWRSTRR